MMPIKSLQAVVLFALLGASLCSCSSGRIEARNPTISEMDALDVQWGLPQRNSRGGVVRRYESSQAASPSAAAAPARVAPAPAPAPQPAAAPAAAAPSTVDPNVIKSLR